MRPRRTSNTTWAADTSKGPGRSLAPPIISPLPVWSETFKATTDSWQRPCPSSAWSFSHETTSVPGNPLEGFHAHRAPGGDRHHRRADRAVAPRRAGGPRGGPARAVHQQPQADRPGDPQLREHVYLPAAEGDAGQP